MKKLKDIKVEDLCNHKLLPYIYFIVVTAFMHIASFEFYGDDNAVLDALKDTMWEEIKNLPLICKGWSGRYLINPFIHLMMHFDYRVWLVIEMLFFVIIYQYIKKHGIMSDRVPHLYILSAMMCTLTFLDYYEIGWRVSTITYIWVAFAFMTACSTIVKCQRSEKIKWYQYIVCVFLTFFATNKEEISIMAILIFAVAIVVSIKNRKPYVILIVQLCISVVSFLSHLWSPNNQARYETKMFKGTPDYGFFDKVTIGVSSTFRHVVFEHNFGFLCLVIVLMIVVWFTIKEVVPRVVSLVPVVLWFMTWIPAEFDYFYGSCSVGPRAIIVSIVGAMGLIAIIVCVYYIYEKSDKFIWLSTILVAGFAGRMVVGFANNGWQRYERTYTFLYLVMIIVASVLACDAWDKLTYRKKQVLFGVIITLGTVGIMKNVYDLGII